MNEFPIVTLSELVVPCFSKMPINIKVSFKPLFRAICVIPFLVVVQVSAQDTDKTPSQEADKEPARAVSHSGNDHHARTESKSGHGKVHIDEHVQQKKHSVNTGISPGFNAGTKSAASKLSTADKSSNIRPSSDAKSSRSAAPNATSTTSAEEGKTKSPAPLPLVSSPTPTYSSQNSTQNSTQNSSQNSAPNSSQNSALNLDAQNSSGNSPATDQQSQSSNGGYGKSTNPSTNSFMNLPLPGGVTSSQQNSTIPVETGNSNSPNSTTNASQSSSSWVGSFIDSLLNFPLLNSKTAPSPNARGDLNAAGNGPINLGPVPVPVPTPVYLAASKHSTPLSTPYSLSTGERNTTGDNAILDMAQAFKRGDRKRLTATLNYAIGHPLEPWAAYWELRARLDEASYSEVRDFLKRYAGTYQEDRLRNDWLLMAGSRREWDTVLDEYPYFRMRDDKELQCYYLLAQFVQLGPKAQSDTSELVLQNWHALRDADDGCMLAVDRLYDARKVSELDIWRKVRAATEFNQARLAKNALKIIEPKYLSDLEDIFKNPARYLSQPIGTPSRLRDELIAVALIRLSASDPSDAVRQLQSRWMQTLNSEQRTWVWACAGREAALKGDPRSLEYFEHASIDKEIGNDELLAWKVRVALRVDSHPRWDMVESATSAMSSSAQRDPTWAYWRARALLQKKPQTPQATQEAQTLLYSIAGVKGFYEQLALEELGKKITSPARPDLIKGQELTTVKANPALRRALYAINLGLRSEGNREWNYATNLVDNAGKVGGMTDKELLAAASYACELEVWDRCVNSAERSKLIDVNLRFPMPFKDMVIKRSKEIAIDPAYVYGLIRQESRFIMDAKSNVGASGLMQIMPKTAAWTAKKIGLLNFKPELLTSREVNIAIGTGYLKLVLDSFDGSMPMAAAAYNAGPSRVRRWQEGSVVEGAIWAEFVPFNETRDYVKKVLANTINYQALITSEPQSLKARLGTVGPVDISKTLLENPDLP